MPDERISKDGDGDFLCLCGNRPWYNGFHPCDALGRTVQPTPEEWTTDNYVCNECGRIFNINSLIVVDNRNYYH